MSRCSKPAACTADTAPQSSTPMVDDLGGAESRALSAADCSSVWPAHELHPQANPIADLLGAVDRHDVRVPDLGEQPALPNDRRRGSIDRARGAGRSFSATSRSSRSSQARKTSPNVRRADALENPEMTPPLRCVGSGARDHVAMDPGDRCEQLQVPDVLKSWWRRRLFPRPPSQPRHRREPLGRGLRKTVTVRHCPTLTSSSTRSSGRARAARPYVPHRRWACPTARPAPRTRTPFRDAR